jgi:superfamily II DNA or RNA helicase
MQGVGAAGWCEIDLRLDSPESYQTFLRAKSLPQFSCQGRTIRFPARYAGIVNGESVQSAPTEYEPIGGLFDYQAAIVRMALARKSFSVFADCGLGKTLILLEFARHAQKAIGVRKRVLIVSPLMVIDQTIAEAKRFYDGQIVMEKVRANRLDHWMRSTGDSIGITNYDALTDDITQGNLGCLILDESSMLKSHYGKWGTTCLRLGSGIEYKLALTGTPAPNDRIEYASHAVFCEAFPTVNAFLARYFINRGQTSERWELKPHAVDDFFRGLADWSIFLTDPSTYGWSDNSRPLPPINVQIHDVPLTGEQKQIGIYDHGNLFAGAAGSFINRGKAAQIAKGNHNGRKIETRKPEYIKSLVESWPDESTIIWCKHNAEQDGLAKLFPDAANIDGSTPIETRLELIEDFKAGRRKVMISKPKILGFGLNLQIATRQIFSGLQDSYEEFYQAVKRSNRYGSTKPLNVHIPVTELEIPMVENVLRKAHRINEDTRTQERIFKGYINVAGI